MTTSDLQEYIDVIEKVKNLINSAEFDQVFAVMTSELPKSKQFLLKMELKRMAQPCDYFIDLRGLVNGDVQAYPYRDKTHYMDDNAIRIFEKGLKQYGQYTLGLYEEVMNTDNNYRVMHRKETEQRIQQSLLQENLDEAAANPNDSDNLHYARLIRFGHFIRRHEERMNFSNDVEILTEQGRFNATTTDLSVSGCKLKVPAGRHADTGQHIKLIFKGLEQEFVLDSSQGIPYQIVETETQEKYHLWRLKRLPAENDSYFTNFLTSFINSNKRRYKVNLDNTEEAVTTRGYEQFYVPRLNGLPVYIAVQEGKAIPIATLTTDYNKATWHYFQDEQQQSVLVNILSGKRLKHLLQQENTENTTILYCFTHAAKGKLYFYSATKEELSESEELRQVYLGFGASKTSWRVFHCQLYRTNPKHSMTRPSIPGKTDESISGPDYRPSPLIQQFIRDTRFIACLTDITSTTASFWYQANPYQQQQLKLLAPFGHKKHPQLPRCEAVPVQYVNLRSESRYLYKTSVQLRKNITDLYTAAFSRDFSSKGMQIETSIPCTFQKGDILLLSLPDMQQISNKFLLQDLPYEVMAVSKSRTIMNLRVLENNEGEAHTGRLFLQQVIQNNRAKLTLAEESPKYPGLASALRNMYLAAMNNFVFYLHRKGIRYDLNIIAQGARPNSLHRLLATVNPQWLDPALLLKNNAASLHFANQLKSMKRFDTPQSYELYIRQSQDEHVQQTVSYYDFEFATEQEKGDFVLDAIRHHTLFAYRISLCRTGRLDTEYIARELNYVSVYAIHRAKLLEEELWSVAGVAEAIDISAEIQYRFRELPHPQSSV